MVVTTREVRRDLYRTYWEKAKRFAELMESAEAAENWNGAALAAIHCAISSVDALTTFHLSRRAASQRHEDAASLLALTGLPDAPSKARQFTYLLSFKTLVEYEPEIPTEKETLQITLQTRRLFEWARANLNS